MLHWTDFPVGSYIADHDRNTLWEKRSVGDWRHRDGTSHNVPEGEVTPDDVIPAHGTCIVCDYPARRNDDYCCDDCKNDDLGYDEEEDEEEWPDSEDNIVDGEGNIVEDEALSTLVEE
jgi:hypothetical protein